MKPSIPPGARADRRMSRVNPGIEIPSVYAFLKNDFAIETLCWSVLLWRVSINPKCVLKYSELKLEKKLKYIIYRLSDKYKEIIVEDASSDEDWEVFQGKLMNAKASHKGRECKGPRFAIYDFEYELGGGEGTRYSTFGICVQHQERCWSNCRNRLVFISWSPDEGTLVIISVHHL